MRILQVIPQLDAGGAERTTLEVAEAIIAKGGRAYVASEGGRLEGELAALGGELLRLPVASKNPWTMWQNGGRLARLIRDLKIDIVHVRSRAPALSAKRACDLMKCHFVTTYHGTYNARSRLKRWYNSFMARGELVIANSNFIKDHIIAEHGLDEALIRVIPRGVDLDRFDPLLDWSARCQALAEAWELDPTQPIILLPARLTAWKGQREALRAYARVKRQGLDLPRLVLAGDAQGRDSYLTELEGIIATEDLGDDVRIVGHCADMPAALAMSRLVLTPSVEPEAFGRTAAEAGAMRVPVIACDHGGAREVVVHGKTGWRVNPGDVAALASAISEALTQDAQSLKAMGDSALAHVRGQFSTSQLQASTLRVYDEVLNSRP